MSKPGSSKAARCYVRSRLMALPTEDIAEGRIGFRETLVRFSLFFVLPLPKSKPKPNTTVASIPDLCV